MGEYYGDPELHAPKMYGERAASFIHVLPSWSIHDVLKRADCIVPGVPTFFLVARGSNYHTRFLESVARR